MIEKFAGVRCKSVSEFLDLKHTRISNLLEQDRFGLKHFASLKAPRAEA
jgi:hypothetical protein